MSDTGFGKPLNEEALKRVRGKLRFRDGHLRRKCPRACHDTAAAARVRLPLRRAREFGAPEFHDPADQIRWQGLTEGELYGALCPPVPLNLFFERLNPARRRVESHVLCIAGEMDQMLAVEIEGGHCVADRLDGVGG